MNRVLKVATLALLAGVLVGYGTSRVEAKPEYTKKEGKPCAYCHATKPPTKELNDTGKCYAKNDHSLKTCAAPKTDTPK